MIQNKEKLTFVTLLGLEKSRKKVEDLIIQAKSELEKFSVNTENLMKIAEFVETRKKLAIYFTFNYKCF